MCPVILLSKHSFIRNGLDSLACGLLGSRSRNSFCLRVTLDRDLHRDDDDLGRGLAPGFIRLLLELSYAGDRLRRTGRQVSLLYVRNGAGCVIRCGLQAS